MNGLQNNRNTSTVCTIIVVTPLVAIMKDQVEQLRGMGVSLAAIGVDERADGEAAKNGKARSSMESQKVGCRRSGEENYKRVS